MPSLAARGRDVVVTFEGRTAIAASDFTIPAGALTAVIGPNGSGKSTLLNVLTGLVKPQRGEVTTLGMPPGKVRSRIAYVLQTTKVNEVMPMTVREVVGMGRYASLGHFRRFSEHDRSIVASSLDRLGITDLAGAVLTDLSGGQRQRVFVAQGLAQEADLLLLDEPVTGLDIASRGQIVDAVREEVAEGHSVVSTTHDLADAGEADHVILVAGKVVAEGAPVAVLDPDLLARVFGVGILHLEDGSVVLDDAHHASQRHVHLDRGG